MLNQQEIERKIAELRIEQDHWRDKAEDAVRTRNWKSLAAHNCDVIQERIRTLQWALGIDVTFPPLLAR